MSTKVFISYSHDSGEHEERVLNFADRLRNEGIDAMVDRYEGSPEEGWPSWMESQIADSEFVLVVCTETYLGRVKRRELSSKGRGAVWESQLMYTRLYADRVMNKKFIPVFFEPGCEEFIPDALKPFTRYCLGTSQGYDDLYGRLTGQTSIKKPPLGTIRALPAKERSPESLPTAVTMEHISKIVSNPRYADDLYRLDRIYDRKAVVNRETIILVVGVSMVAELLDRAAAELLRAEIDRQGGTYPFRRAIILTDQGWAAEAPHCGDNAVIAIGGPATNQLSHEFDKWARPADSREGKYSIHEGEALTGFFRTNAKGRPQVGLWGRTGGTTRNAVEHYIANAKGLTEFLRMCWK